MALRRVDVAPATIILDLTAARGLAQVARPDRRLAVPAGNVEDIFGLAQARQPPAQAAHERLSGRDRGAQMRRARREIAVVEIIRLDAVLDEAAHQRRERLRVVVDAAQQHGLPEKRDAGISEPGDCGASRGRELARVVGVQRHIRRLALGLQRADERRRDARRIDQRHARVEADHLHMGDRAEPADESAQAPRGQDQRIAAGDDHLPDLGPARDVGEGGRKRVGGERAEPLRPDHLAAEAEAAIDRAGVERLQQHAVRIAVHDALDGTVRRVSDRVVVFVRPALELAPRRG